MAAGAVAQLQRTAVDRGDARKGVRNRERKRARTCLVRPPSPPMDVPKETSLPLVSMIAAWPLSIGLILPETSIENARTPVDTAACRPGR